jgi:hypothetical protein
MLTRTERAREGSKEISQLQLRLTVQLAYYEDHSCPSAIPMLASMLWLYVSLVGTILFRSQPSVRDR